MIKAYGVCGRAAGVLALALTLLFAFTVSAQSVADTTNPSSAAQSVPRLIRFGGVIRVMDSEGKPRTGLVGVTFALYQEQEGGAPLWLETQNVSVGAQGRYTVLLGSSHAEGLPLELFTAGEARWLGMQVEGGEEQPRVLLVSVPYALKAADAETLGGKPLSEFVLAQPTQEQTAAGDAAAASAPGVKSTRTAPGTPTPDLATGTPNYIAMFTSGSDASGQNLGNSNMIQSSGNIGIGTTPASILHLSTFSPELRLTSTSSASIPQISFYDGATLGGIFQYRNSGVGSPNIFRLGGSAAGSQFVIITSATERVRVNAAGNVGIGTTTPGSILHLSSVSPELRLTSTSSVSIPQISFYDGATLGGIFQYRNSGVGSPNLFRLGGSAAGSQFVIITSGTEKVRVDAAGNMGIGTSTPSQKLQVAGSIKVTGANGYFFPDNSNQIKAALTDVSGGGLQVAQGAGVRTLSLLSSCAANQLLKWSGSAWACADDISTVGGGGGPVTFSGSNTTTIVSATQSGAGIANPSLANLPPSAISGRATNATGHTAGVIGITDATSGGAGVAGIASTSNNVQDAPPTGVYGAAFATTGYTKGVSGEVFSPEGVAGDFHNEATSGTVLRAAYGPDPSTGVLEVGSTGFTIGVMGQVGNIRGNTTVSGSLSVTGGADVGASMVVNNNLNVNGGATVATNLAVNNNLSVGGNLTKASGSFKIDHPLDPENKFLYHSFVESPDMMNIYNGNVTLDARGRAWVTLPDWFEGLNQDFRYQLTSLGRFAPVYIAREINGNRFLIAGGRPHGKVSWQVTGVRHDAYANAHRIPVEEAKPAAERGTYLYPELFPRPGPQSAGAADPTGAGLRK